MSRLKRALDFARLVEQTRQYEGLLDSSPDAIMITEAALEEPGPIIRFVNAAFEHMSGYSRAALIGRNPRLLQGQHTDQAELARMKRELTAQGWFEGEVINYRPDSGEYLMGWAIAAIRSPAGTVTGWLAVQNDIGDEIRRARIRAISR